jgi:hypothetical protein
VRGAASGTQIASVQEANTARLRRFADERIDGLPRGPVEQPLENIESEGAVDKYGIVLRDSEIVHHLGARERDRIVWREAPARR